MATARAQELVLGIAGRRPRASAAACIGGELVAFCEQERIGRSTRVLGPDTGMPESAIDAVLSSVGRERADILSFASDTGSAPPANSRGHAMFDHHLAHAGTAFLTSPFSSAAVVVCDSHVAGPVSAWAGAEDSLSPLAWPWEGAGFAEIYSQCAVAFGFPRGQEHRLEALARLSDGSDHGHFDRWLGFTGTGFRPCPGWQNDVVHWLREHGGSVTQAASVASSFQRSMGDALVAVLRDIRQRSGLTRVCLGGGLFFNTYLNTRVATAGTFDSVYVPPHPGTAGLSAGAALLASPETPREPRDRCPSPFLGPGYSPEEIKATLDNCKLRYEYLSERQVIDTAVEALTRGLLVGWFHGRMEWGTRALGHRSILASPACPYVLENLNAFLKRREPHRTYGLSVRDEDAARHFDGPPASPFMEFEYVPKDPEALRSVLPSACRSLRVQTVGRSSRLFWDLHAAFAEASGAGILVNTSLNGFSEPIVCSPRDAVRAFFGTGLDMLVMDRFVMWK